MTNPLVLEAAHLDSPARVHPPSRSPVRVAVVQECWRADRDAHLDALAESVRIAARRGARLVCLQELTLSPYFAAVPDARAGQFDEDIPDGPTCRFVADLAGETKSYVHASLFERSRGDGLGFDTAVVAGPDGDIAVQTRKLHIPATAGYHEDRYFEPGPVDGAFPTLDIDGCHFGFPTCWDQWFPELARIYALHGADALVYPSAIGSEPDHPGFDTAPLWRQVIVANGIMNGMFMLVANRFGAEGRVTFYGHSFISDPYGRILVEAPRDQPAVLIADLDLDQRRDWLDLFPFLGTRRPDAYGDLVKPIRAPNTLRRRSVR
jgi:N-carbamoylputrescine amidase